jgi:lipoprotein-anchoring transpeptidase ErfK/SrfK
MSNINQPNINKIGVNYSHAKQLTRCVGVAVLLAGTALWTTAAQAQVFAMVATDRVGPPVFHDGTSVPSANAPSATTPGVSDATDDADLPASLRRQVVDYPTAEPSGTIIVDTPNTYLYYVLGNGKAIRYGIGVGREGFTWSGIQNVTKKAEWPDWTPPPEMIERQPYLPRFMAGGPGNPLGARAMYLGGSVYRIHGTNDPSTIGHRVSSGCIRLTNEDVSDLYTHVNVGTKVVVLPMAERSASVGNGIY